MKQLADFSVNYKKKDTNSYHMKHTLCMVFQNTLCLAAERSGDGWWLCLFMFALPDVEGSTPLHTQGAPSPLLKSRTLRPPDLEQQQLDCCTPWN